MRDIRPDHASSCGCDRRRRTVTDYVLNPCRRARAPLPVASGEAVRSGDVEVQIYAAISAGRVDDIRYAASSCATLTAYAELLGDMVVGQDARQVAALAPETLIAELPGVPAGRWDRAALVARAWWSAVARAMETT